MLRPPVLIAIDVQVGFLEPAWGATDNPAAENNIRSLIARWRGLEWPLVLVRHDSLQQGSPLSPTNPGNAFQEGIDGPHDLLVTKSVNSAFYGEPDLHQWLRDNGHTEVVICGLTTNHCCETTARMAGNLGYDVRFVADAMRTFDRKHPDGFLISAAEIARSSAASLHGEFATVTTTAEVLATFADSV